MGEAYAAPEVAAPALYARGMARVRAALLAAASCVWVLVAAWMVTQSSSGRALDLAALQGFVSLRRPRTVGLAEIVAHLGDPLPFLVVTALLVGVALARGRRWVAVGVPLMMVAANATTQVLKPLLPDARGGSSLEGAQILPGSWPSGHATASMAMALGAVLVAPPRLRPLVAVLGAGFAIAVSFSLLALGWHFPSDVLAGYAVAAAWTALGVAGLWALEERRPRRARREAPTSLSAALLAPAGAACAGIGFTALVFLARPRAVLYYAQAHTTFMVGAAAIALTGVALATALAVAMRR